MTKPPNIKNCTGPPCERHWTMSEWGPVSWFIAVKVLSVCIIMSAWIRKDRTTLGFMSVLFLFSSLFMSQCKMMWDDFFFFLVMWHFNAPILTFDLCRCSARGHVARERWCVMCTVRLQRAALFPTTSVLLKTNLWPSTPAGVETALRSGWAKSGRRYRTFNFFFFFFFNIKI